MRYAIFATIGNILGLYVCIFIIENLVGHSITTNDIILIVCGIILYNQHLYGNIKSH